MELGIVHYIHYILNITGFKLSYLFTFVENVDLQLYVYSAIWQNIRFSRTLETCVTFDSYKHIGHVF